MVAEGKLPMALFVHPLVVRYVAIIRDPIALTLSQYSFGKKVGVISPETLYSRYTMLQCKMKGGNRQVRVLLGQQTKDKGPKEKKDKEKDKGKDKHANATAVEADVPGTSDGGRRLLQAAQGSEGGAGREQRRLQDWIPDRNGTTRAITQLEQERQNLKRKIKARDVKSPKDDPNMPMERGRKKDIMSQINSMKQQRLKAEIDIMLETTALKEEAIANKKRERLGLGPTALLLDGTDGSVAGGGGAHPVSGLPTDDDSADAAPSTGAFGVGSWKGRGAWGVGTKGKERVEQAKSRLDQFYLVLTTERLNTVGYLLLKLLLLLFLILE